MKRILTVILLFSLYFTSAQEKQVLSIDPMGHTSVIFDLCFSSDGKRLLTASWDRTIRIWDTDKGRLIHTIRFPFPENQPGAVYAIALTPDNKHMVVATDYYSVKKQACFIRIIDMTTYAQLASFPAHKGIIVDLKFSPDGKYLASSSSDGLIKIWDFTDIGNILKTNQPTFMKLEGHANTVYGIDFSRNMKYLVSCSEDKTAMIWKLPANLSQTISLTKKDAIILDRHSAMVRCIVISSDAKYVFTGSMDENLFMWDIKGNFIKKLASGGKIASLCISDDGKKLFAHNGGSDPGDAGYTTPSGYLYSLPDGNMITMFNDIKDGVVASAFYKDAFIAIGGWNKPEALVWDPANSRVKARMKGMGACIYGAGFGGGMMVGFSKTEHEKFQPAYITHAFDFENLVLHSKNVVSNDYKQSVFEYKGRKIHRMENDDPLLDGQIINHGVNGLSNYTFTPKGDLVIGSSYRIRLFNRHDEPVKEFAGHNTNIWALSVSDDSRYLVSGAADETVKLWNLYADTIFPPFTKIATHTSWHQMFVREGVWDLANNQGKENWLELAAKLKKAGNTNYQTVEKLSATYYPASNPLVSLFVADNNEWICWTPSGYFACSPNADKYIGWLVYSNPDSLATFYPVGQLFEKFYHPDIIRKVVKTGLPDTIIAKSGLINQQRVSSEMLKVPVAVITSPREEANQFVKFQDGLKSANQEIKLGVSIANRDQVEEIRVYQNMKLIHSAILYPGGANQLDTLFDVGLLNGENELSVSLFNHERTESPLVSKTIYYAGSEKQSDLYVVAVGINKYKNPRYNLTYSRTDAEGIVKITQSGGKKLFRTVNVFSFYDERAIKDSLFSTIDKIKKTIRPGDVFLFYYAGHGLVTSSPATTKDEFYLVLHDITSISESDEQLSKKGVSADELFIHSKEISALKQVFIFDACHSGGAVDAFSKRGFTEEVAITQLARSAGIVLLAASETQQYATEFQDLNHGVFTYSIIEALSKPELSIASDEIVTVKELAAYLESRVPELTVKYRGQVQYPTGFNKGQDFPIVIIKK